MDFPQAGLQNVDLSGGLGGVFAAQNQMDAQKMRQAEIEGKGLSNTFQGLQNERYGQATPLEMQKLGGEAESAEAKGTYDKKVLKTKIEASVAENAAKMSKADMEASLHQNDATLAKLQGARAKYLQAEKMGMGPQMAQQIATEFGYGKGDPKIQEKLAPILQDPEKFKQILDQFIEINKIASMSTSKHLQEMDKVGATNKSHEKIAAGNNAATLGAAQIHADASKAMTEARLKKPESVDQMVADATRTLANPNATEQERATAQNIIDTVRQTKLYGNPAAFNPTMDVEALTKGKVPMRPSPIEQAASPMAQKLGMVPEGTLKDINGKKYKKVKGGWELVTN